MLKEMSHIESSCKPLRQLTMGNKNCLQYGALGSCFNGFMKSAGMFGCSPWQQKCRFCTCEHELRAGQKAEMICEPSDQPVDADRI